MLNVSPNGLVAAHFLLSPQSGHGHLSFTTCRETQNTVWPIW